MVILFIYSFIFCFIYVEPIQDVNSKLNKLSTHNAQTPPPPPAVINSSLTPPPQPQVSMPAINTPLAPSPQQMTEQQSAAICQNINLQAPMVTNQIMYQNEQHMMSIQQPHTYMPIFQQSQMQPQPSMMSTGIQQSAHLPNMIPVQQASNFPNQILHSVVQQSQTPSPQPQPQPQIVASSVDANLNNIQLSTTTPQHPQQLQITPVSNTPPPAQPPVIVSSIQQTTSSMDTS